jgi:hypothetical protein
MRGNQGTLPYPQSTTVRKEKQNEEGYRSGYPNDADRSNNSARSVVS